MKGHHAMITLGLLLLILDWLLLNTGVIASIGGLLLVVGLILAVLGTVGRAVGPRPHYW
jgi:hypothetical protein